MRILLQKGFQPIVFEYQHTCRITRYSWRFAPQTGLADMYFFLVKKWIEFGDGRRGGREEKNRLLPLNCCISFTELNQKQNPAAKDCPKHEQSGSSIDFLNEIAAISTIMAILTLILAILAHSANNRPILTVAKYHGSAAGYKMERTEKKRK